MPPRRRARQDGVGNCGGRGHGLGVPLEDEVSQHGENPNENPELGAGQTERYLMHRTTLPENLSRHLRHQISSYLRHLGIIRLVGRWKQAPRDNTTSWVMESMREFRRAGPPKFDGEGDDFLKTNYWLV